MKGDRCTLFSTDINQMESDEKCSEEWSSLLDEFGALNVDGGSPVQEGKTNYSLAACIEGLVNRLVVSNVSHDVVSDIVEYSKELVCKATQINKDSMRTNNVMSAKAAEII